MSAEEDLTTLRTAIDSIDDKLLELLNDRARLVHRVAAYKTTSGKPFYVPTRERAIVDRLQAANVGPFPTSAVRPVFQEIISACLALEVGHRIAFLGPEGTFAHLAVKRHFGTAAPTLPCGSIPAVFAEVERGGADFGVVPVENSSEGVVYHTLDSFVESSLTIQAEIAVRVEQCLVARLGVDERTIERVYSHPQGLAQARDWLTHNLARAQLVETASTSEAARRAAEDPNGAAVASELAARLNGLAVLRQGIQNASFNVTRFLVLGRGGSGASAPVPGEDVKTTVLLVLGDRPGDLFEALRPFSEASINLTRIESRPSRKGPWEYVFFLDLEGHAADPRIASALAKTSEGRTMRILGSYRKADET
ncbi:MAG TPA: prephenate dehydratase [Kofleriaceae bacterium]|jgi:chorismate mutase/prephenate dehydratase|nr:prephenate dehydratase [Kofleriaceae bacterium]